MKQCENCNEWVEDVTLLIYPLMDGDEQDYHVCPECSDHLLRIKRLGRESVPEVGSPAAQRNYKGPALQDVG